MPRNHVLQRLVFILFLVGLAAIIHRNTTSSFQQEQRLPDGSTLTLEAVTYGPEHRFICTTNWGLRLLHPLLPAKTWEALGLRVNTAKANVPEVPVAWLVQSNQPTAMTKVIVFDEHGCEAPVSAAYSHQVFGLQSDDVLIACPLLDYPPCGRQLGLRFYDYERHSTSWQPVAEFRLPQAEAPGSPVSGPVTVWDRDLSCTLTRFVTGSDVSDPLLPVRGGRISQAWTHLELALQQEGRKTPDWRPVGLEAYDPSGEVFEPRDGRIVRVIRNQGAVTKMQYPWNLFPRGSEWNLRVELARTETAPFAAEELWTIPNVAISPPDRTLFTPGASAPRKQVGNGTVALMDLRWRDGATSDAELYLKLSGLKFPGTWVTLVRAVDDQGREVSRSDDPGSLSSIGYAENSHSVMQVWLKLPFRVARQARSVDLTLAVHRTRFVDLLATPTQP